MNRKKKKTRRVMYGDIYPPKGKSKYALKKKAQARGVFSPSSPFCNA